ncbi:hypothetical protein KKG52_03200 [Patescibacteria group bacterium]|nr:hypothetical protein [Patescibacteria group bacterium]
MEFWINFCPKKLYWELTFAKTKGENPSYDWIKEPKVIRDSLKQLKKWGIKGIRLIIYPTELTKDGKVFNWKPVDIILKYCKEEKIEIDFCLGPFQYPHYPGIYLPQDLLRFINSENIYIDDVDELKKYSLSFLEKQLKRYGKDKRINEFYLGNEWPDFNKVEERRNFKMGVSEEFMLNATKLIKKLTKKQIILNTNIDPLSKGKINKTFAILLSILGKQGVVGLDIYPSQETWEKSPIIKLARKFISYASSLTKLKNNISSAGIVFSEVEAQPWGSGKSWFKMIKEDPFLVEKTVSELVTTINKKIISSKIKKVTLWSCEFWLVAKELNISLKDFQLILNESTGI